MKRLLPIFLLFALLLSACVAPAPPQAASSGESAAPAAADDLLADIMTNGAIRISTDANYEPQSFLNSDGEFIGFDIDVAKEIASVLASRPSLSPQIGICSPRAIGVVSGK